MTAHIRLVLSEDKDRSGLDGQATGIDEAPVGLPEEASPEKGRALESRRDAMLGEAAPPLVAEPEDRAGGGANPRERRKGALASVVAFARGRKGKGSAAIAEAGSAETEGESEAALGNRGDEDAGAGSIVATAVGATVGVSADGVDEAGERERPKGGLARLLGFARPRKARPAATRAEVGSGEAEIKSEAALGKRGNADAGADTIVAPAAGADGAEAGVASEETATTAAKGRGPIVAHKGAIAVVLLTGVAAAAIIILNWPHPTRPPVAEPGMLADQPTKLMAPSAALATVPPREATNAGGERLEVRETRGDEVNEVLSFKGLEAAASTPAAPPRPTPSSLLGGSVSLAKPAIPATAPTIAVPANPPAPAGAALTDSAPKSPAERAATVADSKPEKVASVPPPDSAPAFVAPLAEGAQEPGLGQAAKIESRLGELEAKIKERSNATVTRADIDKAETQTSDQIAQLAAIVTHLTGQVKDLEGQVQTESAGTEAKLADLTRRVSMSESKSAVAAAERANGSTASASAGVEGQAQGVRMKVAGVDQKRNYRIQAASPGLAMLSAIDGGSDDRPVEVAIGTDLPGYGKVRSIEQHGQAWVVKADRGSIE